MIMTELNSIEIPAEFVALCREWYSGSNCKLYAVASTGGLTMGALRPSHSEYVQGTGIVHRPLTDSEWYWSLWSDLACDVRYALRLARGADHDDAEALGRFETFADGIADKLAEEYGIDI